MSDIPNEDIPVLSVQQAYLEHIPDCKSQPSPESFDNVSDSDYDLIVQNTLLKQNAFSQAKRNFILQSLVDEQKKSISTMEEKKLISSAATVVGVLAIMFIPNQTAKKLIGTALIFFHSTNIAESCWGLWN
jgi:hypothetical protein